MRKRAVCFTLIVFMVSCDCLCSVSLTSSALDWAEVSVCGISWAHSLVY